MGPITSRSTQNGGKLLISELFCVIQAQHAYIQHGHILACSGLGRKVGIFLPSAFHP